MNLCELKPDITVEQVLTSVGKAFLGQEHHLANGFTLVNPSDEWFPGECVFSANCTLQE